MNRRKFVNRSLAVSLLTFAPKSGWSATTEAPLFKSKIKPKRLKKGDTIGLIAPGYAVAPEKLEKMKALLTQMGYKPYHTNNILGNYGYFSATDQERIDDIHHMFSNPEVAMILCARGGYGCTRIIDQLDYNLIKKNPKILMGFSDITALANAITEKTGLITFHGPVGTTLDNEYGLEMINGVIIAPSKEYTIIPAAENLEKGTTDIEFAPYTITPGKATGKLAGGNLVLLTSLMGTDFEVDCKDKIIFIEEIEERTYRIDRMLTQLISSGQLQKAAGIALGIFEGCNTGTNDKNSFTLKEVIIDRIKPLGIPAAYGLSIGHIAANCTLPIGVKATFDADAKTITLLEEAVV
ncbi:LD-carboxypeptidase [Zhouia sp. PK063]|uniref:LD-carboxypeptidase n=1 Tax=Zhouia sp. PK063 TaxID=3373602 RepID=UPI0037A90087